jgi:ABC-type polar amino acid transport system ATPase subunit
MAGQSSTDDLDLHGIHFKIADSSGFSYVMDGGDLHDILEAVGQARRAAELVIFSIHAHQPGNWSDTPADFIQKLAYAVIEAGADAVIGHGPHRLRGIEVYHGRPIFYSLGLRQSLGVVLQDNFLFRGSIRDNIIAGRPGLTLPDAVKAARLAGAEEFIERMRNGYETYVEEGSPNLSGGQKQRIAIARALIHDPRILILDEATSALDPESEAVVSANLSRIAAGRTMVIVSHRLASLTDCDQILVMEQGKLMDIGPHHQLLERCAMYRQLWAQQHRHLDGRGARGAVTPRLVRRD